MKRKNKLLILGAGTYQVPLIKEAKRLGYFTVVVSLPGDFPGFAYADRTYYIDTKKAKAIVKIAQTEQICGICTTGTDVAMPALGKVVDALGLAGVSYRAAVLTSNKWRMKCAMKNHARTPKFSKAETLLDAYKFFDRLGGPIMLKAIDSSGGRGIVIVKKREQIANAYKTVKSISRSNIYLVEECLVGVEFGVQAFVYDNKLMFIMPHGDILYSGQTNIPIGHYVPFNLPSKVMADLKDQINKTIQALGLNNCALNIDLILKSKKVYILEVGARAGATCLPELISLSLGFNYYRQIIRAALGLRPIFSANKSWPAASLCLTSNNFGKIISLVNNNKKHRDIAEIAFDYQVGAVVNKFQVGPDRLGHIIVTGRTLKKVLARLKSVRNKIEIVVK